MENKTFIFVLKSIYMVQAVNTVKTYHTDVCDLHQLSLVVEAQSTIRVRIAETNM